MNPFDLETIARNLAANMEIISTSPGLEHWRPTAERLAAMLVHCLGEDDVYSDDPAKILANDAFYLAVLPICKRVLNEWAN